MTAALAPVEPIVEAHAMWRYRATRARRNIAALELAWEWYPKMRKFAVKLKRKYGKMYPHMTVFDWCCFIAILSARVSVKQNMDSAEILARLGPSALDQEFFEGFSPTKAFGRKAARILRGESGIEVLQYKDSEKTFNFARDIYHANKFRDSVTLDAHMLKMIGWFKKGMSTLEYECLAWGLVELAKELGLPPMVLQALLWIDYRGSAW